MHMIPRFSVFVLRMFDLIFHFEKLVFHELFALVWLIIHNLYVIAFFYQINHSCWRYFVSYFAHTIKLSFYFHLQLLFADSHLLHLGKIWRYQSVHTHKLYYSNCYHLNMLWIFGFRIICEKLVTCALLRFPVIVKVHLHFGLCLLTITYCVYIGIRLWGFMFFGTSETERN